MHKNTIKIKIINKNNFMIQKHTSGSAGYDLHANEDCIIKPNERILIGTGIFLEIPNEYEGQIRSRSGLAYKHGIIVLNSPGTIDSDYRGEIRVLLFNTSNVNFTIKTGDRIAQIVFNKYYNANFEVVNSFVYTTNRNDDGFGSTGI